MAEIQTQVKIKTRVGVLVSVIFAGAVMLAALGYTVYKGAYKNEPILQAKKQVQGPSIKDLFPVKIYLNGWPRKISGVPGQATIGDIDNDKKPEIIFGTSDHLVYALNDDGSEVPNWPIKIEEYSNEVPAIADLDNDQKMDVIIETNKSVYAFEGTAEIKNGWPKFLDNLSVEKSPVVGNITGDDKLEIIAHGERVIYLLDATGNIISGWPKEASEKITSYPAVGDLNSDGKDEIVYTMLADGKTTLNVLLDNGQSLSGFPQNIASTSSEMEIVLGKIVSGSLNIVVNTKEKNILVYLNNGKVIFDAAFENNVDDIALGDLDGDNLDNIVFGNESGVHVLGKFGLEIAGWPKNSEEIIKFINLADIDNDGNCEVLGTGNERIYAWKNNGEVIRDSFPLTTLSTGGNFLTYPTLANVNNDKVLNVISTLTNNSVYIWSLADFFDQSGKVFWPIKRADILNSGNAR